MRTVTCASLDPVSRFELSTISYRQAKTSAHRAIECRLHEAIHDIAMLAILLMEETIARERLKKNFLAQPLHSLTILYAF